jgi:hypothetical protein
MSGKGKRVREGRPCQSMSMGGERREEEEEGGEEGEGEREVTEERRGERCE